MTSPIILILLISSLCLAVLFPEYQYKENSGMESNSFRDLIRRQRSVYALLGFAAVLTFTLALEFLSVSFFVTHLVLDCIFGIYALNAFRYRREISIRNFNHVSISNDLMEHSSDYVQIHDRDESLLREAV